MVKRYNTITKHLSYSSATLFQQIFFFYLKACIAFCKDFHTWNRRFEITNNGLLCMVHNCGIMNIYTLTTLNGIAYDVVDIYYLKCSHFAIKNTSEHMLEKHTYMYKIVVKDLEYLLSLGINCATFIMNNGCKNILC